MPQGKIMVQCTREKIPARVSLSHVYVTQNSSSRARASVGAFVAATRAGGLFEAVFHRLRIRHRAGSRITIDQEIATGCPSLAAAHHRTDRRRAVSAGDSTRTSWRNTGVVIERRAGMPGVSMQLMRHHFTSRRRLKGATMHPFEQTIECYRSDCRRHRGYAPLELASWISDKSSGDRSGLQSKTILTSTLGGRYVGRPQDVRECPPHRFTDSSSVKEPFASSQQDGDLGAR